jgi:hypothetical protein
MPYIKKERRDNLKERLPLVAGDLNYIISRICDEYITRRGLSYGAINEVMGVLTCVQTELYRRVAAPYEDKKCRENGEVYLNV